MKRFWKIAGVWMGVWGTIAFLLLLVGGFWGAFIPDASMSPRDLPGRLTVFAMLALLLAMPGLMIWGMGMLGVFDRARDERS